MPQAPKNPVPLSEAMKEYKVKTANQTANHFTKSAKYAWMNEPQQQPKKMTAAALRDLGLSKQEIADALEGDEEVHASDEEAARDRKIAELSNDLLVHMESSSQNEDSDHEVASSSEEADADDEDKRKDDEFLKTLEENPVNHEPVQEEDGDAESAPTRTSRSDQEPDVFGGELDSGKARNSFTEQEMNEDNHDIVDEWDPVLIEPIRMLPLERQRQDLGESHLEPEPEPQAGANEALAPDHDGELDFLMADIDTALAEARATEDATTAAPETHGNGTAAEQMDTSQVDSLEVIRVIEEKDLLPSVEQTGAGKDTPAASTTSPVVVNNTKDAHPASTHNAPAQATAAVVSPPASRKRPSETTATQERPAKRLSPSPNDHSKVATGVASLTFPPQLNLPFVASSTNQRITTVQQMPAPATRQETTNMRGRTDEPDDKAPRHSAEVFDLTNDDDVSRVLSMPSSSHTQAPRQYQPPALPTQPQLELPMRTGAVPPQNALLSAPILSQPVAGSKSRKPSSPQRRTKPKGQQKDPGQQTRRPRRVAGNYRCESPPPMQNWFDTGNHVFGPPPMTQQPPFNDMGFHSRAPPQMNAGFGVPPNVPGQVPDRFLGSNFAPMQMQNVGHLQQNFVGQNYIQPGPQQEPVMYEHTFQQMVQSQPSYQQPTIMGQGFHPTPYAGYFPPQAGTYPAQFGSNGMASAPNGTQLYGYQALPQQLPCSQTLQWGHNQVANPVYAESFGLGQQSMPTAGNGNQPVMTSPNNTMGSQTKGNNDFMVFWQDNDNGENIWDWDWSGAWGASI
ncbi:hypothetical protein F5Y15DRAFT_411610 [Xylariaceae sp. FL0016]|nr:hypothetical protein F5Y15DRAFT_411610 [Xylariaceae sp. FL0016]